MTEMVIDDETKRHKKMVATEMVLMVMKILLNFDFRVFDHCDATPWIMT